MTAKSIGILTGTLAVIVSGGPALAHHSYAMFDNLKSVTIEGTVSKFDWTAPHMWVEVAVPGGAANKSVVWAVEGGSPTQLRRAGWSRNTLNPGDKISVVIHPLKNGAPGGQFISAMYNGKLWTEKVQ
jgi:hypothetical protein